MNAHRSSKKPSKPDLTQEQKDAKALEEKLAKVVPNPVMGNKSSKEILIKLVNIRGENITELEAMLVRAEHSLEIERRNHKVTAKSLKEAQRKLKEAGIA